MSNEFDPIPETPDEVIARAYETFHDGDHARAAALASIATYYLLEEYRAMITEIAGQVTPALDALSSGPVGRMLGLGK